MVDVHEAVGQVYYFALSKVVVSPLYFRGDDIDI